jgi:hypothetical protein
MRVEAWMDCLSELLCAVQYDLFRFAHECRFGSSTGNLIVFNLHSKTESLARKAPIDPTHSFQILLGKSIEAIPDRDNT